MKKSVLRYGITLGISFVLMFGIWMLRQSTCVAGTSLASVLCDAAFATGVILLSVGLLMMVSNFGVFDIVAYGMASFLNLFRKRTKDQRFVDFLEYKEVKKANSMRWGHLAATGAAWIAVAGVLLMYC